MVASQKVSQVRAVIGASYEHFSSLLATLGLTFVGVSLFTSNQLKGTGLIVAGLAFLLTLLGLRFGAVPGPVVILSFLIAIGLLQEGKSPVPGE
jgi:hypothetical protein